MPKTLIYRILRKGEVRVNKGRIKPEYKLQAGDIVRVPPVRVPERDEPVPLAQGLLQRLEASIVFEDNKLIVINKPCGIAVHGGSGELRRDRSLSSVAPRLQGAGVGSSPGPRHVWPADDRQEAQHVAPSAHRPAWRWRGQTLHGAGARQLGQLDQERACAVAKSNLRSGERMVEVDEEGKEALTLFKVLRRFGDFATMVEAKPVTGRTHQIRVHTLHAGHCIAGDTKYGDEDFSKEIRDLGGKRLFLHAYMLTVPLPDGGELKLQAPVDEMWAKTVERLSVAP